MKKKYDHVAQITLLIDQCLKEANKTLEQLDGVTVSTGPGSYTALRVGTATAKGICYALEKPLLALDTLKTLAFASQDSSLEKVLYCPMIDARRMEVYTALFDTNLQVVEPTKALILSADSFHTYLEEGYTLVISGNGAEKMQRHFK